MCSFVKEVSQTRLNLVDRCIFTNVSNNVFHEKYQVPLDYMVHD